MTDKPQISLRPLTVADAPKIAAYTAEPAVARMIGGVTAPTFPLAAEGRILIAQARAPLDCERLFAIDAHGLGLVGEAGAYRRRSGTEIGYWVARPYWGRGYATEAARQLIARLGDWPHPLSAVVPVDNPASRRVLEKLGFRATGAKETRFSISRGASMACDVLRLTAAQAA